MIEHYTGYIKPGNYGIVRINGHDYILIYNWWQRILLHIVKPLQRFLWYIGIAIHDPIFGECTIDFNCCCNIGRKKFIQIRSKSND